MLQTSLFVMAVLLRLVGITLVLEAIGIAGIAGIVGIVGSALLRYLCLPALRLRLRFGSCGALVGGTLGPTNGARELCIACTG